uniref:inositol-1,4-bisphosphate 1-phosphatase n=1 Tax=Phallusia mammillata TaxID=59560 RepID=A0A6F9DG21_9ASCI|nr:inositol polyphosphate 1-phosphatase-like [Phallusia mammillata]
MAEKLLLGMLKAGQKATKIAQLCRAEKDLFEILVQEKGRLKSNDLDFKTLADVFIQQVAKSELEKEFPGIGKRVYGEENNEFTNTLGETIFVKVEKTVEQTAELLAKVVDGNKSAPRLLAQAAHDNVEATSIYPTSDELKLVGECEINIDQVAFWIDPIDGTSQYVKGIEDGPVNCNHVHAKGLHCVTVLIGAYDIMTGLPIVGVVYQPFYKKMEPSGCWKEMCYWGICHNEKRITNCQHIFESNIEKRSNSSGYSVVSSTHDQLICNLIPKIPNAQVCVASGAGYKSLCVILGLVDVFVYSDDACYKWDTCATQAISMALGGNIVTLKKAMKCSNNNFHCDSLHPTQVKYKDQNPTPACPWANVGGLLVFNSSPRSKECTKKILEVASEMHLFEK